MTYFKDADIVIGRQYARRVPERKYRELVTVEKRVYEPDFTGRGAYWGGRNREGRRVHFFTDDLYPAETARPHQEAMTL